MSRLLGHANASASGSAQRRIHAEHLMDVALVLGQVDARPVRQVQHFLSTIAREGKLALDRSKNSWARDIGVPIVLILHCFTFFREACRYT
jgi:hypothetical protein